jgi:hypothetical protein
MGYLHEKRNEYKRLLDFYNYELSNEVVNRKLEWQKEIAKLLENEKYDGILNIEDECISVVTDDYDTYLDMSFPKSADIAIVASNDGEVYAQDADGNEYFLEDITEAVFERIYEAVVELTK